MTSNRIGFVYPGQGAQQVGMGSDLCEAFPFARERFRQADAFLGYSLQQLCFKGPLEILSRDLNAQLGIYTVSTIITDILKKQGIVPDLCTGYSSGFYAAAYAAGCFDFLTGLSIVKKAGTLLLNEGRKCDGGMAVVFGLSRERVLSLTREVGTVDMAIHNTPRQIVISGLKPGIEAVMAAAMGEGALDTNWLPAATAYHSRFMEEAGISLRVEVDRNDVCPPQIPLYSYTTLERVPDGDELINAMALQVSRPVLWVDLIRKLIHNRVGRLVEIGPGSMLSRSIRWIDRHIDMLNTSSADGISELVRKLR
jgi:[acyl-carrier-protein] S-malonyltransferase